MAIHLPALALTVVLLATGCTADEAGPATTASPADDAPVPVEGDGGIGGEEGGPVTSNLILASDAGGADQVEVTGTCLDAEDPPTYRLDLAGGGVLTAATGSPGTVTLVLDGTTFASPEDQPPVVSPGSGAISVQGRVVSGAGDEHFVDAVIGLEDLPDC